MCIFTIHTSNIEIWINRINSDFAFEVGSSAQQAISALRLGRSEIAHGEVGQRDILGQTFWGKKTDVPFLGSRFGIPVLTCVW